MSRDTNERERTTSERVRAARRRAKSKRTAASATSGTPRGTERERSRVCCFPSIPIIILHKKSRLLLKTPRLQLALDSSPATRRSSVSGVTTPSRIIPNTARSRSARARVSTAAVTSAFLFPVALAPIRRLRRSAPPPPRAPRVRLAFRAPSTPARAAAAGRGGGSAGTARGRERRLDPSTIHPKTATAIRDCASVHVQLLQRHPARGEESPESRRGEIERSRAVALVRNERT